MLRASSIGRCGRGARALGPMTVACLAALAASAFGQGLCWDNDIEPNGFNGRAISPPLFPDIRVAADFTVLVDTGLVGLRVSCLEDADWVANLPVEVYVYDDAGTCPGDLLLSLQTDDVVREFQGEQLFDRDVYEYWIGFDPVALAPGSYYVGSRWPAGGGDGTNYWLTSSGGDGADLVDCFSLDAGGTWQSQGAGFHMAFELYCAGAGPEGACCLPDGSCLEVTEELCLVLEGRYEGDDVSCDDVECPQPPTGACCFPAGACDVLTEPECVEGGGAYQGDDVTCKEAECPVPDAPCWDNDILPNGFNGRATSPPVFPDIRVAADFVVPTTGLDVDTLRKANLEDADWVPLPPVEVYVYADGGDCPGELLLELDAADVDRVFQGYQLFDRNVYEYWIRFDPVTFGAGRYYIGSRWPNAAGAGTTYWLTSSGGAGADRTDCFSLDAGASWQDQGPDWHMAFQLLCAGNPLDLGACCFDDERPCVVLTETQCVESGGTYQGDGVSCAEGDCPPPPRAACCFPDGSCVDLTSEQCANQGGAYQGDDVPCDEADCPQPPTGACCFDDGTCEELTTEACAAAGGDYQGDGIPCQGAGCPPGGACCFPDGSCAVLTAQRCGDDGGDYRGDGVSCADADCPQPPRGACCLPDGGCLDDVTEQECDDAGEAAEWQGEGVTCADVKCKIISCPPDLDGDGIVEMDDLTMLLAAWGDDGGPADLDGNGDVGWRDLLILLAAWGPCF